MSFGSMPLGTGPYGSGLLGDFAVRQSALNAVDLTFFQLPEAIDWTLPGDALRTDNWRLVAITPTAATVRLPQWAVVVDPWTVRLYFDGELDQDTLYEVDGDGVLQANGTAFLALFGQFMSIRPRPAQTQPQQRAVYDIANPALIGTFGVTPDGDLANDSQFEALKKRVARRLVTSLGGFFHLPNFGLAPKIKGTITPSLLLRLQAQAIAQAQSEPDVLSAAVAIRQDPTHPNIVTLTMRLRTRGGDQPLFVVPVNLAG